MSHRIEVSADWPVATSHDIRPCTCGRIHIVFYDKDRRIMAEYALEPNDAYSFAQEILQGYDQQEGL